jgi:hypothetical protein
MAILLGAAIEMIGFDTTIRINCQVSPRPTFGSLYCPVNCDAKAWGTLGIVSTFLYSARLQHLISHSLFSRPLPTLPLLPLRC